MSTAAMLPGTIPAGLDAHDTLLDTRDFSRIGRHLVPMSWMDRARWLNSAVAAHIDLLAGLTAHSRADEANAVHYMLQHLKNVMKAVLDQIDLEAPGPLDAHGLALYRVSGDPARMVQAAHTREAGPAVSLDELPGLAEFERLQTINARLMAERGHGA